ncbi:hypothetical protein DFH09DRAFT_1091640 [Mycena vulgaris]|nr:hypothetical protein DFH09DRAFT_1091640 [Mycena vulgaris]
MILAAKTIAAGAELVPLPCIRAACGAAVIFLETVDGESKRSDEADSRTIQRSIQRSILGPILDEDRSRIGDIENRSESVFLLRSRNSSESVPILEISLLIPKKRSEQRPQNRGQNRNRVQNRMMNRSSLTALTFPNGSGWKIKGAVRFSGLCQNFVFKTTFRNIPLGDINLPYETATSKTHNIKIFAARISINNDVSASFSRSCAQLRLVAGAAGECALSRWSSGTENRHSRPDSPATTDG